ncbi:MAG: hypothetical protein OEV43_04690 [Coriobacteriia bacterium]|nr:hypothetical protein [Coriobacteriia bacterium]
MEDLSDTRDRVQAALAGEPGIVVGLSFVPLEALEGLRWGGRGRAGVLAAACERLCADFAFVPAEEPWAEEAVDHLATVGTEAFWVVPGPFGLVADREGWAETIRDTLASAGDVATLMDAEMSKLLERVRRGARLGVSAIVIAEDLAGTDGLLVAPDYALDEIVTRASRLVEVAAEGMVPAVFHSDGDIRSMLAAIRRSGFAGVHVGGAAPEVFGRVYEAACDEGLSVVGGLTTADMRSGGPVAIDAGSRAGELAIGRGLLVSDDGGITTSEEVGALVTAIEAARDVRGGTGET